MEAASYLEVFQRWLAVSPSLIPTLRVADRQFSQGCMLIIYPFIALLYFVCLCERQPRGPLRRLRSLTDWAITCKNARLCWGWWGGEDSGTFSALAETERAGSVNRNERTWHLLNLTTTGLFHIQQFFNKSSAGNWLLERVDVQPSRLHSFGWEYLLHFHTAEGESSEYHACGWFTSLFGGEKAAEIPPTLPLLVLR